MGVCGQRHAPAALLPGKRDPITIVQAAGWAPGPVWTGAENLAPPLRLDPRTVHHVLSHYTDWAIAAHNNLRSLCRNDISYNSLNVRTIQYILFNIIILLHSLSSCLVVWNFRLTESVPSIQSVTRISLQFLSEIFFVPRNVLGVIRVTRAEKREGSV